MMKSICESVYRAPQLIDRGAVEIHTKDTAGTENPEHEHDDNIVWGNFTPETSDITESEE